MLVIKSGKQRKLELFFNTDLNSSKELYNYF